MQWRQQEIALPQGSLSDVTDIQANLILSDWKSVWNSQRL